MKIESQVSGVSGIRAQQLDSDKALQNVFAEVLAQSGRHGYVSAEPLATEAPLADSIADSWNQWFQTVGQRRYDDMPSRQQLQQDFGQLLVEAHETGAYAAPQAFLKSLTTEQLSTIQGKHTAWSP